MKEELLVRRVLAELENANAKFPPFNSPHEGYAVIKEELDEVKRKEHIKDRMVAEAIQVAAMAMKFVMSL